MDLSIKLITPEIRQDHGYAAFYDGLGPDDHGLTDPADIKHWQAGWHVGRVEQKQDREWAAEQLAHALAGANPP